VTAGNGRTMSAHMHVGATTSNADVEHISAINVVWHTSRRRHSAGALIQQ